MPASIKSYILKFFCFYMLAGFPVFSFAQQAVYFKTYTSNDGLPAGTITSLWADPKGYLWLLSENGLCRFDGYDFVEYRNNPSDPGSLPSSTIVSAHADSAHNIFFVTASAIAGYSYKTERFNSVIPISAASDVKVLGAWKNFTYLLISGHLYRVDFSKNEVKSYSSFKIKSPELLGICFYNDKLICITSDFSISFDLTSDRCTKLPLTGLNKLPVSISPTETVYFYQNTENKLFLSCEEHLFEFEDKSISFKEMPPRQSETSEQRRKGKVKQLLNNTLVILSTDDRLYLLNLLTGGSTYSDVLRQLHKTKKEGNRYFGLFKGKNNNVFVQCRNEGVIELEVSNDSILLKNHYTITNSELPFNDYNTLLEYNKDIIWLFAPGKGLVKCEKNKALFKSFTNDAPQSYTTNPFYNNIRALCEGADQSLLIGSLNGVFKFDLKQNVFSNILHPATKNEILKDDAFSAILKDADNTIWISSWNNYKIHILNYTNKTYGLITGDEKQIKEKSTLTFRCSYLDPDSFIYMGMTNGTLLRIRSGKKGSNPELLNMPSGSTFHLRSSIFSIKGYSRNELLLCTAKGLYVFNKSTGNTKIINEDLPLLSSDIRCVIPESKEKLWIGTNGNGLLAYNPVLKTIKQFTINDGLSDNSVYSMLQDKEGNLWMGTNKGLNKYAPESNSIISFSDKDGILFEEFNTNAATALHNGNLAFGGINGFIVFNPDTVSLNTGFSTPILTKILSNNDAMPLDSTYRFRHFENYLTFQFATLNFFRNEEIRYAYKLEGLDENWIYCGTRRFTTYANLSPGNYIFKVKCSNPHGEWNNAALEIPFTISTPWYKSWYFFVSVLLLILAFIYSWLSYKNRQNMKLISIRENIARDLHDEIGSNLSSISIFNQVAKEHVNRKINDVMQILDKIGEYTQISQEAMSDIVWMIDSKNDRFENILVKMRTHAAETVGATSIHLIVNFDEKIIKVKIDGKQRKNLYLIFKESLNNILKYAQCNNVWIDLFEQDHVITLLIKDDGIGFNMAETKGNGLINMKKRAEEINGILTIDSSPGKGTSVQLKFDL